MTLTFNTALTDTSAALAALQAAQTEIDALTWEGSDEPRTKTRHISFHLTIAAAKMARVEERADHGILDEAILDDVAADLLIYALQLASIRGAELSDLYQRRVCSNLQGEIKHT